MTLKFSARRLTILLVFSVFIMLIHPLIMIIDSRYCPATDGFCAILLLVFLFVGLLGIMIDYLLYRFINNKWILNILELLLIALFIFVIWPI